MIVEAVGAAARIGADEAELADFQIVQAQLRSDSDSPVDGLESRVTMKQVKRKPERLIEEGLLPFAEKSRAARARAAHVAGRRNAAAIEKRFGRGGNVQKNLLAEQSRPDGFIALETISIERIVPAMLGVDVLAALRIAAVIGLLEGPAVWNRVVHIGDRRQRVR